MANRERRGVRDGIGTVEINPAGNYEKWRTEGLSNAGLSGRSGWQAKRPKDAASFVGKGLPIYDRLCRPTRLRKQFSNDRVHSIKAALKPAP